MDDYLFLRNYKTTYPDFDVIFIFSPGSQDQDALIEALSKVKLDFTICIDVQNDFRRLNPQLPDDPRFHTLLINQDRQPVFVGNPVYSDSLWELFTNTLDGLY